MFLIIVIYVRKRKRKVIPMMEERRAFCTVALVEMERAGEMFLVAYMELSYNYE